MPAVGPFTVVALFVATLYTFQSLVRYAKAKDANGAVSIILACVAGIGVVALAAHSDATASLRLITDGQTLGKLDMGSQIMVGIAVGSAGPVLADFRKAFDGTTTAAKPMLVGPKAPPADPPPSV